MPNIDDISVLKKCDASNMLKLLETFPAQVREAKKIGESFDVPASFKTSYKNIVCTGLGGSAIGADILRSYIAGESRLPVFVNRSYTLPKFVDASSLVIVSSYSGNTEETISAYKDALSKGAKIIAVTSGGTIESMAASDGFPAIKIPGGLPPRCALGYSFFPVLILLSKLGIIGDKATSIDEAIGLMEQLIATQIGPAISSEKNIAKTAAKFLFRKFPVIYANQANIDCAATRWRGEIAENSKTLSSMHLFPEMNHNEIVGWEYPKKILKDFAVIMLRDKGDDPRIAKRIEITKKILIKENIEVMEVYSQGDGLLSRVFSLISIGDFVSYYLSILNEVDPTPVERITYLKNELAKK